MAQSEKLSKKAPSKPLKTEVPDVYTDMLADANTSSPTHTDHEGRIIKRRRVGGRLVKQVHDDRDQSNHIAKDEPSHVDELSDLFDEPDASRQRIVKSESDDSANDMDWEEVDLQRQPNDDGSTASEDDNRGELNLDLRSGSGQPVWGRQTVKRKPISAEERKLRLEIHKLYLCCLLAHVYLRNVWCDDSAVQKTLCKMLTKKTVSYLNPNETMTQFQRSRSFMDGLQQASEVFRTMFKVTARGLSKPAWAGSPEALAALQPPTDIDLPMQKSDFIDASKEMNASRDIGAQLFCALLRSVGVDARLVCSLQTLPFHAVAASTTPQRSYAACYSFDGKTLLESPEAPIGSEPDQEHDASSHGKADLATTVPKSSSTDYLPSRQKTSKRPIRESKYPVYWVEAFNEAAQKWIPVDPLVTKTIGKASKFEPPAGERENNLAYVVAFEEDGTARDVTRRYAKAYNAKTRRDRVDSVKDGDRWWRSVMKMYRRHHPLDRDQVEDTELNNKEAQEPMPKNVLDFKDHPYYALERHLRRNEVVHPKREVGKVSAGKSGGHAALESIYRRRDVHIVLSADKWYRMGREIKAGEQAMKRVTPRRTRDRSLDPEDGNVDKDDSSTSLYAIHQTETYVARPVINGRIPKNVYGNLDVYVPSMIPPGGSHVDHPETARAAKILGIDYADAVTGFTFKGRHGTAVTRGAVIASEHKEAVLHVIAAFEDERVQAEEERRTSEALRIWKRLLAGLRIRERIEGYDVEGERDVRAVAKEAIDEEEDEPEDEPEDAGGGFFPGGEAGDIAEPTAVTYFDEHRPEEVRAAGGFSVESTAKEGEVIQAEQNVQEVEDDTGGGFMIDENCNEVMEHAEQRKSPANGESNDVPVNHGSNERDCNEPKGQTASILGEDSIKDRVMGETLLSSRDGQQDAVEDLDVGYSMSAEELEEARTLEQLYENSTAQAAASTLKHKPSNVPEPEWGISPENTSASPAQAIPIEDLSKAPVIPDDAISIAVSEPRNSSEDKGSLMSEDPEDEDAEPDWLA